MSDHVKVGVVLTSPSSGMRVKKLSSEANTKGADAPTTHLSQQFSSALSTPGSSDVVLVGVVFGESISSKVMGSIQYGNGLMRVVATFAEVEIRWH